MLGRLLVPPCSEQYRVGEIAPQAPQAKITSRAPFESTAAGYGWRLADSNTWSVFEPTVIATTTAAGAITAIRILCAAVVWPRSHARRLGAAGTVRISLPPSAIRAGNLSVVALTHVTAPCGTLHSPREGFERLTSRCTGSGQNLAHYLALKKTQIATFTVAVAGDTSHLGAGRRGGAGHVNVNLKPIRAAMRHQDPLFASSHLTGLRNSSSVGISRSRSLAYRSRISSPFSCLRDRT